GPMMQLDTSQPWASLSAGASPGPTAAMLPSSMTRSATASKFDDGSMTRPPVKMTRPTAYPSFALPPGRQGHPAAGPHMLWQQALRGRGRVPVLTTLRRGHSTRRSMRRQASLAVLFNLYHKLTHQLTPAH